MSTNSKRLNSFPCVYEKCNFTTANIYLYRSHFIKQHLKKNVKLLIEETQVCAHDVPIWSPAARGNPNIPTFSPNLNGAEHSSPQKVQCELKVPTSDSLLQKPKPEILGSPIILKSPILNDARHFFPESQLSCDQSPLLKLKEKTSGSLTIADCKVKDDISQLRPLSQPTTKPETTYNFTPPKAATQEMNNYGKETVEQTHRRLNKSKYPFPCTYNDCDFVTYSFSLQQIHLKSQHYSGRKSSDHFVNSTMPVFVTATKKQVPVEQKKAEENQIIDLTNGKLLV